MFLPTDSASYSYLSNARGGDLTHTLKYDNAIFGGYDSTSSFSPNLSILQEFDANNNITAITSSVYGVLTNKTLFTYNSSNLPTSKIQQSWNGASWSPLTEDVYGYNGSNQLTSDQHETWNMTAFVVDTVKSYNWDNTTGLKTYELDNYFVSGFPIYTYEWSYTYDTSTHYLLSTVENISTTGALTGFSPVKMVAYYYDSSGNLTEIEKQHYNNATSAYVPDSLHAYSNFTSSHMPQADEVEWWDTTGGTWVNLMMFSNTYNTAHQLTSSTGKSWNITGIYEFALGDPMYNYYYGTYSGSTVSGIKNVTSNNGDANIYPVPAQNMLHIDLNWNEAQSATMAVYDIQGRVVKLWDAPYGTQYSSAISVNDLSDGVYLLKINGQQGQIVKQIVVTR